MRVLMVVRPAQGGMKGQVIALSRGLIDAGHTVEIAAPPESDVARRRSRRPRSPSTRSRLSDRCISLRIHARSQRCDA